jgi:predicted nucleotidyltransferase
VKFLNNKDNFGKNSQFLKNKGVQKYFYMKRKDLENILKDKVNIEDINSINERLGKGTIENNNINNE